LQNELEQLRRINGEMKKKCRQLEQELHQSEERFSKIFHASTNLMTITSIQDGRILDLNEAAANLGGFAREELIGMSPAQLGLWADPKQRALVVRKLAEDGHVYNLEVDFLGKSGETHRVLFSADPITVNKEPCMLSVAVDITTQRKEAEALKI
jgi:PAS domain S-box-containing protein